MPQRWACFLPCFVLLAWGLSASSSTTGKPGAFDWPQWQGPDRTALSRETGLLKRWPKGGPPLLWKATGLGGGYGTPSVAAGRILGLGFRGPDEVVWALAEGGGKELWTKRIAAAKPAAGREAREGSRSTPTVEADRLYALGENGDLVCMKVANGEEIWHQNLVKDYGGRVPRWGYSESPLIDGEKLICTPGGKDATLVALDKMSGKLLWKAKVPQGDGAAYASVAIVTVNGQRQYVQLLQHGLVGVSAMDGKFLWRYNRPANGIANCSTPVVQGQRVFAASGYGTGGGLVKLGREGKATQVDEIYFTKHMKNQHGGMVLVDGYLYGENGGLLACLEFLTGNVMWEDRRPGKGSITYADGRLYYRNERGPMYLVEANPKRYVELGHFDQPDRSGKPTWPHPVIANGRLYLRDQDVLLCYDVKER
jgi:outer membrane protein assembly factor BamB